MTSAQTFKLTSCGRELEMAPDKWGELRRSEGITDNVELMRHRMQEDGYLYMPGFFDRDAVQSARLSVLRKLSEEGALDPAFPIEDGIVKPDVKMTFRPDIANQNEIVKGLIYSDRVMSFYEAFLGGPARHYDYTWMRAVAPGIGTNPHLDIVFMGRGTRNLFTLWTPMDDITLDVGGLIILENSHRPHTIHETYGQLDVDAVCTNIQDQNVTGHAGFKRGGAITDDPVDLRDKLGGRWLTAEFKMGDVITFGMSTIHASLDNQSRKIRLSTDSRYQLASEPVDERWVGDNPVGHGPGAKRGVIC